MGQDGVVAIRYALSSTQSDNHTLLPSLPGAFTGLMVTVSHPTSTNDIIQFTRPSLIQPPTQQHASTHHIPSPPPRTGLMVTASHNAVQDNGVKMVDPHGGCVVDSYTYL